MDGKESTLIHYEEGINFILAFFVMSYPDCVPLKHDVLRSPPCGISSVTQISRNWLVYGINRNYWKHTPSIEGYTRMTHVFLWVFQSI